LLIVSTEVITIVIMYCDYPGYACKTTKTWCFHIVVYIISSHKILFEPIKVYHLGVPQLKATRKQYPHTHP